MTRKLLFLMLAALLSFAPAAYAQSEQANCQNLDDPSFTGWTSHAQLTAELASIERTSGGKVEVQEIGRTHRDRAIYRARVGTGDRVLLVTSAIHGNEKTGTEALLRWLRTLGSSGNADVQAMLRGVTIVAVPMFNPDGGELNRRQNDYPWADVVKDHPQLAGAEPAWYYSGRLGGFDVNRDFNPDLAYEPRFEDLPGATELPGFFLTRESRTLRAQYLALREEFGKVDAYVDLHHMGSCEQLETNGDYVTVALDYPPLGPEDSDKYDAWPLLDQDYSRRLAYAAALGMDDPGVARYFHPEWRDLPGQARSSFGLNGTGTVLFEVRGQSDDWGQKMMGRLTNIVQRGVNGIATRLADGSVDHLDGDRFFDLPRYWDD